MTRATPLLAAVAGLWLAAATPADAARLTLNEGQQADALRAGQRSVTQDSGFDAEWKVENTIGESVIVVTPFYRLALAARNAAFKSEAVKPQDQTKILDGMRDRLTFWVHLNGPREDFARYYTPRLLVGDLEVVPVFVQNERTSLRQPNGSFLARSIYAFPTKDVTDTSRVVLVVRDSEGQLKSRFAVDLAKMR